MFYICSVKVSQYKSYEAGTKCYYLNNTKIFCTEIFGSAESSQLLMGSIVEFFHAARIMDIMENKPRLPQVHLRDSVLWPHCEDPCVMCHVCVLHKTIFMCLTLLTVFLKYISKLLSLSAGTSRALISWSRAVAWSEYLLRAETLFRLEIVTARIRQFSFIHF